ncbi:hypothetical protein Ae201684_004253 [Aphanomyces euteiches]|uniref:Uncharacterized protein n=1 Tax=Aphanomyces euteiches TaxID=100861 RepID=A0A6G0XJ91_9STRA|nr:hypothetical protein Ae201684_004253 [Aphanomyces euteiches]
MIHPVVARVSSRLLREGPPTSSGPQSTSTAPPIDVEIMPVTDKHGRQLISANDLYAHANERTDDIACREKIDALATRRESFRGSTIGLRTPPTEPLPRPRPIKHIPPLAMVEPHVDQPNEPRAQSPEPLALPDITEDALAQLTAQTEMEIQISPPRQDLKALDTYDRDKTLLHHDPLPSSCLSGSLLQSPTMSFKWDATPVTSSTDCARSTSPPKADVPSQRRYSQTARSDDCVRHDGVLETHDGGLVVYLPLLAAPQPLSTRRRLVLHCPLQSLPGQEVRRKAFSNDNPVNESLHGGC